LRVTITEGGRTVRAVVDPDKVEKVLDRLGEEKARMAEQRNKDWQSKRRIARVKSREDHA
jgi:hypothetical protein